MAKRYARRYLSIYREEQFASLVAGGGVVWAVDAITRSPLPALAVVLTPGPLETCSAGILVWLHAKWRRSLKVH
jgi:hypothetical protein